MFDVGFAGGTINDDVSVERGINPAVGRVFGEVHASAGPPNDLASRVFGCGHDGLGQWDHAMAGFGAIGVPGGREAAAIIEGDIWKVSVIGVSGGVQVGV